MIVCKQIPEDLDSFDGDLMVAVVGEDERPLLAANAWLDWRLYGSVTELIVRGVFTGKLNERCLVPTYGRFNFDRLVLVGGGNLFEDMVYPTSEKGSERWIDLASEISQVITSLKVAKVGMSLPRFDLADQERALLKVLQSSRLPVDSSIFISRGVSPTTGLSPSYS